jgi:hypothetical protein
MHLIQDASQPDHVRNDAHPWDHNQAGGFNLERWAKDNSNFINALAANPQMPTLSLNPSSYALDPSYYSRNLTPVALLTDTDQYNGTGPSTGLTQGIAEYTNGNFASEHTIFAEENPTTDKHYFPYPRKSSTDIQNYITQNKLPETKTAEDGVGDVGFWIAKTGDGETYDHFAKPTYLTDSLQGTTLYNKTFYQDTECHKDYVKFLLPRAVGYSAALLKFFFRGTLEISAPSTYVYSIIDGSVVPQQFTKIKAKVRNTSSGENMGAGTLQAVARYKVIPNYAPDLSNYPPDGPTMLGTAYSYSVSAPIDITSLSSTSPTEFTFDFTTSPVPAGITDLTLQVVFKGTLGNEVDNAVAVGMRDLNEPEHIAYWNLTDMFSLNYHLYTASEIKSTPTLSSQVDFNPANGIFNEPGEPHIDSYPIRLEIWCMNAIPPTEPVIKVATVDLAAGRYTRLISITDMVQPEHYGRVTETDTLNGTTTEFETWTTGVVNQADQNGQWQPPTPAITSRIIRVHGEFGILNCLPDTIDPVTGERNCPYPDDEAMIPPDITPVPAIMSFQ